MKKHYLIFLFLSFQLKLFSQKNIFFYPKIGFSFQWGMPVNRIGFNFIAAAGYKNIQWTNSIFCFYNRNCFGYKNSSLETQLTSNIGVGIINNNLPKNEIALLQPHSNFTNFNHFISYGIKYYGDNNATSQTTGFFIYRYKNIFLQSENDAFIFKTYDRFRTGSFSIGVENNKKTQNNWFSQQRYALHFLAFMPSNKDKNSSKVSETSYPSPHGYLDFSKNNRGNVSVGALFVQVESSIKFNQSAFFQLGIDDEHVRNFVQNKIFHDLKFIPSRFKKVKNFHVPMLKKDNSNFLFKKNEKVRPAKLYFHLGANTPMNY